MKLRHSNHTKLVINSHRASLPCPSNIVGVVFYGGRVGGGTHRIGLSEPD